ncbi:hypothetical protein G6F40_013605 [Rhizopus arrhizus]|nr:hypothetical protein G6F40_013605 [Rhizopus arrhizus]
MVVAHFQLGDHIVAGLRAQRGEVERMREAACSRFAAAGEADAAPHEGDVLAAALGGGDRQRCLRGHAIVVAGLEAQRPLALPGRAQPQAGGRFQHAHAGCTVGDHVQPIQTGFGQRRFAHHAVQRRRARHIVGLPVSVLRAQRQASAIVELQPGLVRRTVEAQRPRQPTVGGHLGIQRVLGKRGLASIGRRVDAQAGGLQVQRACGSRAALRFRRNGRGAGVRARPPNAVAAPACCAPAWPARASVGAAAAD